MKKTRISLFKRPKREYSEKWAGSEGFIPFITSQFISLVGDRVSTLAFVSLAALAAGSSVNAGAAAANVAAIQIVPIFLLSYAGGMLSDRLSRKWLMWWVDVLRLAVVLLFVLGGFRSLMAVYTVVFLLGTLTALFNPAKRSFIPFLVPRHLITEANWWVVLSEVFAMVLGLALGSLLLKVVLPDSALLFDSLSFAIALIILFLIPAKLDRGSMTIAEPSIFNEIKEGWGYVKRSRLLRGFLFRLNLPFYLASGLFYAAANHWAAREIPDNAGLALGYLLLPLAVGALSSFFLRHLVSRMDEFRATALSFLAGAAVMLGLAMISSQSGIAPVMFLSFLCGVSVGLIYPRTVYLIHLHVEVHVVGRVISLKEVIAGFAFAGTIGLTGTLGEAFSAEQGWIAAAIVFGLGALGMHWLSPNRESQA